MKAQAGNFRNSLILLILLAFVTFSACDRKPKVKDPVIPPVITVSAPDFNADSAWHYVDKQVSFGPRVPGTAEHAACVAWLQAMLSEFADTVIIQDFKTRLYNGRVMNGRNIIASFNPELPNRVLLCAHYDSRPYADHDPDPSNHRQPIDGANDGASGVGVLIEMARQMSNQALTGKGIDIVLFDLEDWGEPDFEYKGIEDSWALGAQYWSKNPHRMAYRAQYGILFDMVGAHGAKFTMEATSMFYAPDIMRKVWDVAHSSGYGEFYSYQETGGITDDHLYINRLAQIPTIDIIHYEPGGGSGFFPHWHTVNDNMDNISPESLKAAGQVVLNYLYR